MRSLRLLVRAIGFVVVCIIPGSGQTPQAKAPAPTARPRSAATKPKAVMRDPFTLRLKIDKDNFSDIHFDRQPYVSDNEVYLFSGDKFGVNLVLKDGRVAEIRYQQGVSMEALMSIPGKKDVFKTSILPVKPGKSGLESWPHPISQLVLGNLQLTSGEGAQPKK